MTVQYLSLLIRGVPDAGHAATIRNTLQQTIGVRTVNINWRQGTGDVMFDNEVTTIDAILANTGVVPGYSVESCEDDACSS